MFRFTPTALAAALVFSSAALAQEQRIEITGSAIKRVDAEGALPVTVITREEIARSGAVNTEALLGQLAAASGMAGINNATGAGSSTNGRSTISLRGLSGGRTLVLVNGRRLAVAVGSGTGAGASVNVNNIPLAAIERVEVLKDGASSIYGSEALAGVVNFILAKEFQGLELGLTGGTPTRSGGGQTQRMTLVGGVGDIGRQGFNLTGSLSLEREAAVFAQQREFARTGNVPPWVISGATGQGNIEGAWVPGRIVNGVWQEGTRDPGFGGSPATGYGNPLAAQNRCADINMYRELTPTGRGTPYCAFDSEAFVGLVPQRKTVNLTLNGAWRLSDRAELFGDLLFTRNDVTQRFQPSPMRRSFSITNAEFQKQGVDPVLLIYPSNPNYRIAADFLNAAGLGSIVGQPLAITARVFDFGPRTQRDISAQSRWVVGGRGELAGQSWEAGLSGNRYELKGSVPDGYFSQVTYTRAVQQSNEWNPWSLQQTEAFNRAIAAAKYTGGTLDGTARSTVADAKLAGDLMKLPAGPLAYAMGLQMRQEDLQTRPSAALFSGDIAGLGGAQAPVDRDRRITSVFTELVAPLAKGLEANVAARHDRYDDVGNANTWKASVRWQPTKNLVLRGGTGTGFRAPTLVELWLPQTLGTSAQFTDPQFPANANLQVNETTGGNPLLKPETSRQQTLGIVFSPLPQLTVTADYWRIQVEGIITAPSTQEIVTRFRQGDPAYAGLVTLNARGEVDRTFAVLNNVGAAKLEGVDLDIASRLNFASGRLDLNLAGTYMIRFDQQSPGGSISRKVGTMVEPNGTPVLEADGGGVVLRWKHKLSATWSRGPWAFTLAQNYYTGYRTRNRQVDGQPNFVPDQALYDLNVSYSGLRNLRLNLGVRNLFDKDPPIYVKASNQFQGPFDISLYDPRARFVYASANYRF